jgi:hypothetical protein
MLVGDSREVKLVRTVDSLATLLGSKCLISIIWLVFGAEGRGTWIGRKGRGSKAKARDHNILKLLDWLRV